MLQVGQELWYVPSDLRSNAKPYTVRVIKVGRKWAKLDNYQGQVDIESLWLDGGKYSSPGKCWLSKEDWEKEVALNKAWKDFYSGLSYIPPNGMTVEKLSQLKILIGF